MKQIELHQKELKVCSALFIEPGATNLISISENSLCSIWFISQDKTLKKLALVVLAGIARPFLD